MDLYLIDSLASSGKSPFHMASALSKLFFVAAVIFAVLVSNDSTTILAIFILLIVLISLFGLPTTKLLFMTSYMVIFAALFAFSGLDAFGATPATIILKASTAALALLTLFATTKYFDIFAVLAKFLPRLVADVLFVTYRSFFILLKELSNLLMALRIRGGLEPRRFIRNLKNLGGILGTLLIHAMDMSARSSNILNIRGYRGGITHYGSKRKLTPHDLLPILLGAGIIIWVATLR